MAGNPRGMVSTNAHDASLASDVRSHDYDRYLCTLFAPDDRREDLIALLALNLELARVRERVSEPMLGQIRLAWWHETMAGVFAGSPRQHPVALAMAAVAARHELPQATVSNMIDAREIEFGEQGFETLQDLERYADVSSGNLHRLCLSVLGVDHPAAVEAAGKVGTAWALIGLLRSVPHHAGAGRVYLPYETLREAGLSAADVMSPAIKGRLAPAVEQVAERAQKYVDEARALRSNVPTQALSALLPAVLADLYLRKLGQCRFNPFTLPGDMNRPLRQLRLLWASVRRKY